MERNQLAGVRQGSGGSGPGCLNRRLPASPPSRRVPEELVEVPVLHVLEDHDEGVPVAAHAVELDDVLVLEVGQQLGLAVEVFASVVAGVLQRLRGGAEGQNQPVSDGGHQREGCLEEE